MEKRWVKKDEVERQLHEIFEMMEQIDHKMDEVISNIIEQQCEQNQAYLDEMNAQLEKIESILPKKKAPQMEALQNTIPLSANVSSKLRLV